MLDGKIEKIKGMRKKADEWWTSGGKGLVFIAADESLLVGENVN